MAYLIYLFLEICGKMLNQSAVSICNHTMTPVGVNRVKVWRLGF